MKQKTRLSMKYDPEKDDHGPIGAGYDFKDTECYYLASNLASNLAREFAEKFGKEVELEIIVKSDIHF